MNHENKVTVRQRICTGHGVYQLWWINDLWWLRKKSNHKNLTVLLTRTSLPSSTYKRQSFSHDCALVTTILKVRYRCDIHGSHIIDLFLRCNNMETLQKQTTSQEFFKKLNLWFFQTLNYCINTFNFTYLVSYFNDIKLKYIRIISNIVFIFH